METPAHSSLHGHRILITGATGFIGSWLTQHLLDRGAHVTALVYEWEPDSHFSRSHLHQRASCVWGAVEDYPLLERVIRDQRIDTVFHLAAVSVQGRARQHPRAAFETNVRGTYNVLEACRVHAEHVRRVIVAASDKVYGDSPTLPYTEDMPLEGRNPYDASKVCTDVIAQSYARSFGLPVAIGRFGNIYGGGDLNWSRLIPNTIRCLWRGERPVMRLPLHGVFKRDFIYVEDLIRAYIAMFEGLRDPQNHGESFNFGTGICWTIPEVIRKIQQCMGTDADPITVVQTQGEILHQSVSPEKAGVRLGWVPRLTLDEGIRETVRWYQDFFEPGVSPDVSTRPVYFSMPQVVGAT